ncbi:MAG: LptF/LptG family permease [Planctomycetota bacterium]
MSRRGLKIGGRLDRYVATLFVSSYATAFFLVVGLFLILDMASNLDEHVETWKDGTHAPTLLILRFYVLSIPFLFLQVAPFVTLVAGLFTAVKLLRYNEVIAALSAGVSSRRLLAPVFVGGALCGVGMFELRELVGSSIARQRDSVKYILQEKQYDVVYEELWLRDLNGSVVHLKEFRPASGSRPAEARGLQATLRSVSRWSSTQAARAVYETRNGRLGWWLDGGTRQEVRGEHRREPIEVLEGFDFDPELAVTFHRARQNPMELTFSEARELARRDPDSVVYATLLQYHVTFPLANLVLLLVGLPALMRSRRGKAIEGMAAGCMLCIFYFAADFVLTNLGLQGGMDPYLAAWLPALFFGSVGLVLLESMES